MYSFSVDQHEESLEYDLLSVKNCRVGLELWFCCGCVTSDNAQRSS